MQVQGQRTMNINIEVDRAQLRKEIARLRRVAKSVDPKSFHRIMRKAAKPIMDDMKANAPTADNDNILNNIGITTSRKRTRGGNGVRVGIVKNKTRNLPNLSAPALAAVHEYGTPERRKASGASSGSVKAGPFLRPAFDKNEARVLRSIATETDKLIVKAGQ